MPLTNTQIANKALAALAKKANQLSLSERSHFACRLYRAFGEKKYLPFIKDSMINKKNYLFEWAQKPSHLAWEKKLGRRQILLLIKNKPQRQDRWQYYQKIPELKFYQKLIFSLKKFKEFQINSIIRSNEFKQGLQRLKAINWPQYFFDEQLIYFDPVQTVNLVFWLNNLEIIDLRKKFIYKLKKVYPPIASNYRYTLLDHNRYYTYTHIIIAASDYYQKFVSPQEYSQATKFLKQALPVVLKSENLDLIAELGVCLKLLKKEPLTTKLKLKLKSRLDPQTNLLKLPSDREGTLEHTNVLMIMLLKKWQKLSPGPKIEL